MRQESLLGHTLRAARALGTRWRRDELGRLGLLAPRQPAITTLLGNPVQLVDAGAFLSMYKEIFELEVYRFQSSSRTPFIIDGGANIGLSVLYFKRLYPDATIVAFEPDADIYPVLMRNLEANGIAITVLPAALWRSRGMADFVSYGVWAGRLTGKSDSSARRVPTVRLYDYLDRQVDFLKLDIEGAETEVLEDCADRLDRVQSLFVEYHSFADEPQALPALLEVLRSAGFRYHMQAYAMSAHPLVDQISCDGFDNTMNIHAYRKVTR